MADDPAQCMTVWERVRLWYGRDPDREAYIFRSPTIGRTALTRADLHHMSFTFADLLARAGVSKGDMVCNTLQVGV